MKQVLIVDDHQPTADGLVRGLAGHYGASSVTTYWGAIRKVRTNEYWACLVDLNLDTGGGDGISLMKSLRAIDPRLKLFAYSGFKYDDHARSRIVELGAILLPRPLSTADLIEALKQKASEDKA
jgi:ActR/RegA family two-component response regulator